MRSAIENWLLGYWYGSRRPPWYLRMLVPLYRSAYLRKQTKGRAASSRYRSALPLIVVGNITAGGSGKTPLVIRLSEIASEMNFRAGIASTGYGRSSRDTLEVHANSDTDRCGDEPVMLASRTSVPVVVAANRLDAVKKLNTMDLDILFSDDGLQQADMDRDIEFCVIDGERGLGNGQLIPAGPLRESAKRLRQVDYVICNGEWADKPDDVNVHVMNLRPGPLYSLENRQALPMEEFRQKHAGNQIHAVAGIGHPGRFFRMLEQLGLRVTPHAFPDHHHYSQKDFDSIKQGSTIIMTEKDAVKCRALGLTNAWYIPVETELPGDLEQLFRDQLKTLIEDK